MPRSIQVSLASELADRLLERVERIEGVVGLTRQRGASIKPPGDVVTVDVTNDASRSVFALLEELRVPPEGSVVTTEPKAVLSDPDQGLLNRETNETVWDEEAFLLREDSNLTANFVSLMALAGAVATVGLWTDTLHIVVGSMIIAPAFEPLIRMPFGFMTGSRPLASRGLLSSGVGYGAMIAAAFVAALLLRLIDPGRIDTLPTQRWVDFWSTVTGPAILVSIFASAAGAFVVSGQRSVLTTGVMIALALIPSASLIGLSLAIGELGLLGEAFVRWIVDVALVMTVAGVVFGLKQRFVHRAPAAS